MKQCHQKILNKKKINYLFTANALHEWKKGFLKPLAVRLLPAEYFMHNFQIKKKLIVKLSQIPSSIFHLMRSREELST
jgi:hypothetical protein